MLRRSPRPTGSQTEEQGGLHAHLLHDHGRTGAELDGLPLAELHRLEHVEHAMGLHVLSHQHPAPLARELSRERGA
jgi:hypothetical protein